jgi:hypothetical protein
MMPLDAALSKFWSNCCVIAAPMRLFLIICGGPLIFGCASHAERPLQAAAITSAATAAPKAKPPASAETIETSHVYLLSPGKDAVRVVVSR